VRHTRRRALLERLAEAGVAMAVLLQNADLLYYAGTLLPSALVLDSRRGEATLYVRRGLERAQAEVGPDLPVRPYGAFQRVADDVRTAAKGGAVGLELDVLPALLADRWRQALAPSPVVDVSPLVRAQRAVKSADEIAAQRRAAVAFRAGIEAIRAALAEGVTDLELTALAALAMQRAGNQGILRTRAFNFEMIVGHVMIGPDGAAPTVFDGPTGGKGLPYVGQGASGRTVVPGQPVLVDIATAVDGYIHDGTRTFALGELSPRLARAHELALAILAAAQAHLRPGVMPGAVYAEAVAMAEAAGLGEHFLGFGPDRVRFLGHGVGLELDELPVLYPGAEAPLEAGMVVAVEPKFVFPGEGAVGVENTYVVTAAGGEALSDVPLTVLGP
jgi:Xaa-Pro dipeptidase